jgi:hypothetical protein
VDLAEDCTLFLDTPLTSAEEDSKAGQAIVLSLALA